jgi:hypothetical protein
MARKLLAAEQGDYDVLVGNSSEQIALHSKINLPRSAKVMYMGIKGQ